MALDIDPIAAAREHWVNHEWDSPDAMAAATSLVRAHQLVTARASAALAPFGLTVARFEALALLHFSRRGALPMGKLGERLQVHPASVTNAITRLERDGYVERHRPPENRRMVFAHITSAGRELVERAARAMGAIDFGLTGLTHDERAALIAALNPVRRACGDRVDGDT
ncbi:MAG TPA: MarR family transcriptional regulator [Miltoncostaeaceae bacterium]|nr:MarR family transcriptional regulator [Miltoncostaeaceae bacterium]